MGLNASSPGGISQGFATIPGGQYLVTFALAGNPEGGPRSNLSGFSPGANPRTSLSTLRPVRNQHGLSH
jgi:hypothetical protein